MRIGIDFGTTRTVVATSDRGNYPVLPFADSNGDFHDYLPSVVALEGDEIVCGWRALRRENPTLVRSFKRMLSAPDVTGDTPVDFGDQTRPLGEVLTAFAGEVLAGVDTQGGSDETVDVVLGVPANANSAQRLMTLDAFSRAGANVLGLVNEPSAAAFGYSHRLGKTLNTKRSSIIVYDLGGGTFDATYLRINGSEHEVLATRGISRLGGDDFDESLLELALESADRTDDAFGNRALSRLRREARSAKEALKPQSRRIIMDLGDHDAIIPVDDFYDRISPLVEQTLEAVDPLIAVGEAEGEATDEASATGTSPLADTDIAGVYLVGGATSLPLVPRLIKQRFGRRAHRSPLPAASTAVGLAIASDPDSGYRLRDLTSRGIGVFRERDSGRQVSFDPLIPPGTAAGGSVTRTYRAAHNVGWMRFVEYSEGQDGNPGDISVLAEVVVPFEPELRDVENLKAVPVERLSFPGPLVKETVSTDSDGIAHVRLEKPDEGWSMEVHAEG